MGASPPNKPTIRYAVDRAATVRRRRYQDDDRYRHFSETAMLEQVCGVEGVMADLGDGWWQVGVVVDVIAHVELEVVINPGERKIRLRAPAPSSDPELPRPESFALERPKRRFSRVSEWNREYEQWREWHEG